MSPPAPKPPAPGSKPPGSSDASDPSGAEDSLRSPAPSGSQADATRRCEALAIFPLENVVLLPRVQVPLHIFEPRYRQMTRAALESDRRIGMVVVRPEERTAMKTNPAVFPIGCEGVISRCEELPDGRFNLMLQGRRRFRIVDEPPVDGERLYRVANVEPLDDSNPEPDHGEVSRLRNELMAQMRELVSATARDGSAALDERALESVDDATLVNALTQSLDFGAVEKQGIVEADSIRERYDRLTGLLQFRLAELRGVAAFGGGTVH